MNQRNLLSQNQMIAKVSMGHRYEFLNWDVINLRKDICRKKESITPWKVEASNFLILPEIFPSSNKLEKIYKKLNEGLQLGSSINQYIDVHGKDPHLLVPLLRLREALENADIDPNFSITSNEGLKPYFMIALGTGDGETLKYLIDRYKPHHLIIALADWNDYATSFCSIDWQEIVNTQHSQGGKFTLGLFKDGQSILNILAAESLAGIDHSVVYMPPEGACNEGAKTLKNNLCSKIYVSHIVNYLGYTIDEINMVWNTWQTLARQPRLFLKPMHALHGRMVVCGSGPSLDDSIEGLRQLSRTHWITACGSSIRTLKLNGIRVDFLALVERADEVLDVTKDVVDEYGADQTRLIMASTCHNQLQDLFNETMVYFRPAVTPCSLFANTASEILHYEGPESINTGVAIASALGVDELILVGVDLGAKTISKVRSDEAVGCSDRDMSIKIDGNFQSTVLTSTYLRDGKLSVEACIRDNPSINVINASDGVFIKGATPERIDVLVSNFASDESLPSFDDSALGSWWNSSQKYKPSRFVGSWLSRRPRAEISALFNSLRLLCRDSSPWNPKFLSDVNEILGLDTTLAAQFPRRILRSTFLKLVIAMNRLLLVYASDKAKKNKIENISRTIILELIEPLEKELYMLCDALESIPTNEIK